MFPIWKGQRSSLKDVAQGEGSVRGKELQRKEKLVVDMDVKNERDDISAATNEQGEAGYV